MKFSPVLLGLLTMSGLASAQLSPKHDMSRFGGPTYMGDPALDVTAGLVAAGGSATTYSTATAFTSMLGQQTIADEMIKLRKQYGERRVKKWLDVFDFAVDDSLKLASSAGVNLPTSTLSGRELARAIVKASMDDRGTVWAGLLLDKAATYDIHMKVMDDIDQKFSVKDDKDYHRITNQALYDIGMNLGVSGLRLARLH